MECLLGLMLIIIPERNDFSVNLQIHFLQQEECDKKKTFCVNFPQWDINLKKTKILILKA